MADSQTLRIAHRVRDEVKLVDAKVERVEDVGDKVEKMGLVIISITML